MSSQNCCYPCLIAVSKLPLDGSTASKVQAMNVDIAGGGTEELPVGLAAASGKEEEEEEVLGVVLTRAPM
jgi:hypothetical protein